MTEPAVAAVRLPKRPRSGAATAPQTAPRRWCRPATDFLRALASSAQAHALDDVGAMLAYYTILAVFPMLLFVVTLALIVVPAATIDEGMTIVMRAMPSASRSLVKTQVHAMIDQASAGFAIGTIAFALWGASRGASALMVAFNRLMKVGEGRSWVRRQLIAVASTIGLAVLLVAALMLLVAGPAAGHFLADRFELGGAFEVLWAVGRWVGAALLVLTVWGLTFKILPDTQAPFRVFTPGAIAGVVLWGVISWLFGFYLDRFASYESTYGALGSVVVFLTWLWLSNMTLLLGAEINMVLRDRRAAAVLVSPD